MKLINIVNAHQVLDGLGDRDINGRLAYWMTKFIAKTQADYDFYAVEIRKLYEKYGEQKEEGKVAIPADRVEEFNKDLDSLNNTDAEDPNIRFNLSEISAGFNLSMRQMYPLLDFINEDK